MRSVINCPLSETASARDFVGPRAHFLRGPDVIYLPINYNIEV